MTSVNEYLLPENGRPDWLTYPIELIELVESGRVRLVPWHICKVDAVQWDRIHLNRRLHRDLVVFAHRQDREDLACFEKGRGQAVMIIHDNTDPGWEDQGSYPNFADWLRAVELEGESWASVI